jgi:hypothetical protein
MRARASSIKVGILFDESGLPRLPCLLGGVMIKPHICPKHAHKVLKAPVHVREVPSGAGDRTNIQPVNYN